MNVLILGGTQFIGRHIVEALLDAGHRVTVLNRGKSRDELPAEVERLRGDRVLADLIKSAGVTEFDLPLFRPERGPRSSLMDVSNERARLAGLTMTDPKITVRDTKTAIQEMGLAPALSPAREAEFIKLARLK